MKLPSVFILLILVLEIVADCRLKSQNVSTLQHPIERVFSRKKRYLLFPGGTTMKITVALGKSIPGRTPRGLALSIELNFYYPMPATVDEWLPKKFKSKKPPVLAVARPPVDIYVPGTLIHYKAKPVAKPVVYIPKIDKGPVIWIDRASPKLGNGWSKRPQFEPWFNQRATSYHNPWESFQSNGYVGNRTRVHDDLLMHSTHPNSNTNPNPIYRPQWKTYKNFKDHQRHRERRDIYNHFEGFSSVLGIDMKSCILRTICESKQFLLPPGHSLIQDILRILFSIPTLDGVIDEYSAAMRGDYLDCRNVYVPKCPFSLLNFVTNSKTRK